MDRRSMFGLFAAALIAGPSAVSRAYAVGEKKHRLAIHVDQSDIAQMNLALGNASNVFEHYKSRDEDVEIEIVTYAQGLHMLRADSSPVKERIKELREKMPNVVFLPAITPKGGWKGTRGARSHSLAKPQLCRLGSFD